MSKLFKVIFSLGLCLAVGFLGSVFTYPAIPTWYATLNKPPFSPPNWIFGPVWTLLYILMGISLYLVWSSHSNYKQKALNFFFIQLTLNFFWSILFFGFKNPVLAFVDIIALLVLIILTLRSFSTINKLAAKLLLPYLLWVSFATILNLSIVILNS